MLFIFLLFLHAIYPALKIPGCAPAAVVLVLLFELTEIIIRNVSMKRFQAIITKKNKSIFMTLNI